MTQLFDTQADADIAGYARVALEQGIDAGARGLTYALPAELGDLHVGDRVIVPLGKNNRHVRGHIIEFTQECDYPNVKKIVGPDPQAISLPPDLIELARWMAGYYCCPIGMVFASMVPAAVKHGTGRITQTMVALAELTDEDVASGHKKPKITELQQAVLDAYGDMTKEGEKWVEIKLLADQAGARSISPVKQLIDKGLLRTTLTTTVTARTDDQTHPQLPVPPAPPQLNPAQIQAVQRLVDSIGEGFSVHLLHGVTGSGKTEVYMRAIERVLDEVRSPKSKVQSPKSKDQPPTPGAIVLVPEIALTPQTMARFVARFSDVAVLHSGLSGAQRHEQWRRIRRGEAHIVIGARSAIFAPLPCVGLIIVDEEHEYSYKQDQLPRYHARDVAIKRAQILGIPVVLGSATPSLESYYNATVRGTFNLLQLPQRVGNLNLPKVTIVDMVQERRDRRGVHLFSRRLESVLEHVLRTDGQAILLLNRRGYANYIACPDQRCGWIMSCQYCDATMVYHKDSTLPTGGLVRCHHCEAEQLLPQFCPQCRRKVTVFGLGTQRVEEELERKFKGVRHLRMDSDVMRSGRDYYRCLEMFRTGEAQVLLGTQMIAKGLDFPNVRLVGVISADTSLHMPDFRAAERTFGLIAQVAGRAGRGEKPGTVIVQTFCPNDPAIILASRHDYEGFARRELELRQEVALPPISRMARIVIRDKDHLAGYERASTLAQHLAHFNRALKTDVRLRGPMPCPISRIAGYHRQQIELIASPPNPASRLQKLLTAARNAKLLISDAQTAVDVDPVDLL